MLSSHPFACRWLQCGSTSDGHSLSVPRPSNYKRGRGAPARLVLEHERREFARHCAFSVRLRASFEGSLRQSGPTKARADKYRRRVHTSRAYGCATMGPKLSARSREHRTRSWVQHLRHAAAGVERTLRSPWGWNALGSSALFSLDDIHPMTFRGSGRLLGGLHAFSTGSCLVSPALTPRPDTHTFGSHRAPKGRLPDVRSLTSLAHVGEVRGG